MLSEINAIILSYCFYKDDIKTMVIFKTFLEKYPKLFATWDEKKIGIHAFFLPPRRSSGYYILNDDCNPHIFKLGDTCGYIKRSIRKIYHDSHNVPLFGFMNLLPLTSTMDNWNSMGKKMGYNDDKLLKYITPHTYKKLNCYNFENGRRKIISILLC